MAWWTMPAITIGAMFLVKQRGKAGKVRWINLTKDDVSRAPIGLIMAQLQSGDALPNPPDGTTWKPMKIAVAPSPFAAVQEITINILEKWEPLAPRLETADPTAALNGMGQPWRPKRSMHRKQPYWSKVTRTVAPRTTTRPPVKRTTAARWSPQPSVRPTSRQSYQKIIGPATLPKHQQQFEWTGASPKYTPGWAPMDRGPTAWARPPRASVRPGWERFVHLFGMGGTGMGG